MCNRGKFDGSDPVVNARSGPLFWKLLANSSQCIWYSVEGNMPATRKLALFCEHGTALVVIDACAPVCRKRTRMEVTRGARSGAKQRHQGMRGRVHSRTAGGGDHGCMTYCTETGGIDDVRLLGDVPNHHGHDVGSFHRVRHPGEGVIGVEIPHDLVLTLQGRAELIVVGMALDSVLQRLPSRGCWPRASAGWTNLDLA